MSSQLYLWGFNDHEPDTRARSDLVLDLTHNKDSIALGADCFAFNHADGGRAKLSLADGPMPCAVDVEVRTMSLGLAEHLYGLIKKWELVLYDSQGSNASDHPLLFATAQVLLDALPPDFKAPKRVVDHPKDLYIHLQPSFSAWERYRDQILGLHLGGQTQKPSKPPHVAVDIANVRGLFDLITRALADPVRAELWQEVSQRIEKNGVEHAFCEVLTSLDAAKNWVLLQVDARDHNEVVWQAQAIAKTLGLVGVDPNFQWVPSPSKDGSQTVDALWAYDVWLHQFEKSLVLIQGGDSYVGFVVALNAIPYAIETLRGAGLDGHPIRNVAPNLAQAMIFEIGPGEVALKEQVAAHVATARDAGRLPLIYLSASWCEPCREALTALHHADALSVLEQVALIQIDIELFSEQLIDLKLEPTCVPLFCDALEDGCAGPRAVDGGAWEDSIPAVIAEILGSTFNLPR